jgi:hypothetical protein
MQYRYSYAHYKMYRDYRYPCMHTYPGTTDSELTDLEQDSGPFFFTSDTVKHVHIHPQRPLRRTKGVRKQAVCEKLNDSAVLG